MFWLCFYNGFDKPEIDCAFAFPFMVVEYAKKFIHSDRVDCYTVFYPDDKGAVSLKNFLDNEKET